MVVVVPPNTPGHQASPSFLGVSLCRLPPSGGGVSPGAPPTRGGGHALSAAKQRGRAGRGRGGEFSDSLLELTTKSPRRQESWGFLCVLVSWWLIIRAFRLPEPDWPNSIPSIVV